MSPPPGLVLSRGDPDKALAQPRPQPVNGDFLLACANSGNTMFGPLSEQSLAPTAYSEGSPASTLSCGSARSSTPPPLGPNAYSGRSPTFFFSCGSARLSTTPPSEYPSHLASLLAPESPPTPSFGRSNRNSGLLGSAQLQAEAKDRSVHKGKQTEGNDALNSRWWARLGPDMPLTCPLDNFPICLLPYPPFKLRMDPKRASPHRLVDGKSLAMQVCISRNITVLGRKLQVSDLAALDDYVQRCKIGPFRPKRAAFLLSAVEAASDKEARLRALKEHERFVKSARIELGKLRSIQENRLEEFVSRRFHQ